MKILEIVTDILYYSFKNKLLDQLEQLESQEKNSS
jgi:hypothetical protein